MRGYIIALATVVAFSGCSQKQPTKVPIKKVGLPQPIVKQAPIRVVQPNPELGLPVTAEKPMKVIVLKSGQVVPLIEEVEMPVTPEVLEPSLNAGNSKSYVTTLKTKKFAFSDAGFLKSEEGRTDLQIFAVGKPLLKLKILESDDICVNQLCNTKHGFNQSYLSGAYPDDLLENVLHARPIFNSQNLKETTNGFMQRIENSQYNIKYKIVPGMIYFKDVKNKIIIKLKALGR